MYKNNLKKIRFELGLSSQKLAEKLDVSQGSIVNYENGSRKPNYEFMEKLHDTFNVNLNWFISGKGEMFINEQNKFDLNKIDKTEFKKMFMECMKETGFI